jgi:hypothetical protein
MKLLSLSASRSEEKTRKKHLYGLALNTSIEAIKYALTIGGMSQIESIVWEWKSCSSTITLSSTEACNRLPSEILIQGNLVNFHFIFNLFFSKLNTDHNTFICFIELIFSFFLR